MVADCDECRRLLREFANATTTAIRVENKLKLAALERDYGKVAILTLETKAAFAARDKAREIFRLHEGTAHDNPDATTPKA